MSGVRTGGGRIGQLANEIQLCWSRGASLADRWQLGVDTGLFHLANYRRATPNLQPINRYGVKIAGQAIDVALRPYAGDFFVWHEVFGGRFYEMPAEWRPRVRTVLDLGAHVGMTALFQLETLPGVRVVCVEPSPHNAALLRGNLQSFGARAAVIEGAVGGQSGEVHIDVGGWSWGGRTDASPGTGYAVRCYTVDEIMRKARLDSIDLLKIDVEGAEAAVFANCDSWIGAVGSIMIEIHEPYSLAHFHRDMARVGLRVVDEGSTFGNRMTMAVRESWLTGHASRPSKH